jgi:peptidoglycan/LPS O-acetylase OafA/YrhL
LSRKNPATRRRWANVAVVVVSAYSLAAAAQFPVELATPYVRETVRFPVWIPVVHALAGALGLAAVFTAVRRPGLARLPLVAGGLLLLSGFAAFHQLSLLPVLSLGIPALVMLGIIPFLGPMPRPEEEAAAEPRSRDSRR